MTITGRSRGHYPIIGWQTLTGEGTLEKEAMWNRKMAELSWEGPCSHHSQSSCQPGDLGRFQHSDSQLLYLGSVVHFGVGEGDWL